MSDWSCYQLTNEQLETEAIAVKDVLIKYLQRQKLLADNSDEAVKKLLDRTAVIIRKPSWWSRFLPRPKDDELKSYWVITRDVDG